MAGLVPAIHVCFLSFKKDVDARHEAGHDGCVKDDRCASQYSAAAMAPLRRQAILP
jgi:hypothetical protein